MSKNINNLSNGKLKEKVNFKDKEPIKISLK